MRSADGEVHLSRPELLKTELADLVAFIKAMPLRPNRYLRKDGELSAQQQRGQAIFQRTQSKTGTPIDDIGQCA